MASFRMSTIVLVTIVALAGKLLTDESFCPTTGSFSFYKIQTQKVLFLFFERERQRENDSATIQFLGLVTRAEMWTLRTPPKVPE